jgi:cellulose synthase/poly-beta-1,6-N-acetylglucosamine synthase-like glycosyltransferase
MYDYLHIGRASDIADRKERTIYRLFEILPGASAWATFALIIFLSFKTPVFMALFIIAFDVYWLVKTIYLSLHLRVSYARLKDNLKINWLRKLESLPVADYSFKDIQSWRDIYHFIFLPVYKEDYSIVATTVESLLKSNYPKDRMAVILCYEERAGEETEKIIKEVENNFKDAFFQLICVKHPDNLPGEMRGKGSNTAYAAKIVKEDVIDKLGIRYEQIIISNFDVDTVSFLEYFGILTHTFLSTPDPLRASYQPVPLYVNNIWEAPSFARVVAFAATFWHTIKQEKSETATTFSSHSMPLQALLDVGYWQKNMVSEDSRIFWQCFLRYDGNYRVVPLYYPVSMDANVTSSTWQTLINVYKQQRRWAYGAENVPYFLYGFRRNKKISSYKRWYFGFISAEGNHSWATNAILLFALGWLPVMVGGSAFNQTVLSFNLPFLTRLILTFSTFGLVSSAILSIVLLPPKPPRFGRFKYFWMLIQWLLFPATTIFLGAIPAIDAQTRLMFGKYMGFWVTPKGKKS